MVDGWWHPFYFDFEWALSSQLQCRVGTPVGTSPPHCHHCCQIQIHEYRQDTIIKIDTNTTRRYRWITHVDPFPRKGFEKKEVQHLQKDRPKAVMTATPKHIIDRFGFLWYRLWGICGISASFMWSSCGQVQEFEIGIKMHGRLAALGQWGTWS